MSGSEGGTSVSRSTGEDVVVTMDRSTTVGSGMRCVREVRKLGAMVDVGSSPAKAAVIERSPLAITRSMSPEC